MFLFSFYSTRKKITPTHCIHEIFCSNHNINTYITRSIICYLHTFFTVKTGITFFSAVQPSCVIWTLTHKTTCKIERLLSRDIFPHQEVKQSLMHRTIDQIHHPHTMYFIFIACSQHFKLFVFSNLSIMSIPDEGYSRNASCALNLSFLLVYAMLYIYYLDTI